MLPPNLKRPLRHATLVGLAVALPLLYAGGVTAGSAGAAGAALGLAALVALLAAISY